MPVDSTRVLYELDDHFNKDPNIDEYDLIPFIETQDEKHLLVENHKLAINASIVPTFYIFIYKLLLEIPRPFQAGHSLLSDNELKAVSYSRAVILVNPETATAWNIRKELVVTNELCAKEDLLFSKLILTKHPKSPETWVHRRWLLKNLYLDTSPKHVESDVILDEFTVCTMAADKYPSNYSAWSHRLWVLNSLVNDRKDEVLQKELLNSKTWINRHISDHSGLHYRGILIQFHIRKRHPNWLEVLLQEASLVEELIDHYPCHEALWYYRRLIVYLLFKNAGSMDNSLLKSWAVQSRHKTTVIDQFDNADQSCKDQSSCQADTFEKSCGLKTTINVRSMNTVLENQNPIAHCIVDYNVRLFQLEMNIMILKELKKTR
ncbi:protein prenyltransferase alpha subunit repeat-containing protein 1-like [Anneissia japonica]|uniref:protein prenyltransferase alpha subunit repeat-containing protein 1-like n=1 Tax=Anneissia japonica TaxID=1529436 RepID=UPI00142560A2|nr:protein prenyltransferase alpha subunit repeat-containing protein 1-like [Anneissia japonica]